ncbi:MAG TPA: ATP-binding protein, partial [Leptolinea sp.]
YLSRVVPFDKASVMLLEDNTRLTLRASRGYENMDGLNPDRIVLDDIRNNSTINAIVVGQRSFAIDDTNQYPGWESLPGGENSRSWLGVPLVASGDVLGLFSLNKATPGFFTVEFRELAESLAVQAAVAIQNARLHEELQQHADELEQRVTERTTELAKRVSEVETLNQSMLTLNENLKAAVIKAESADRLKSAFLATMSHELRTPLNSIIGFTGILLQKLVGPLSEEQEKQLKMVQGSAHHLLELINDVLDISKIEADQIVISTEEFDVAESIRKSVEKIKPLADKKGLSLITEINPRNILITSDRRRVEQILINLLNNAVKFTDHGQVRLECRLENDNLLISIHDTGIGIKPEDLQTLFKPFRQIDTGLTRQYEGTGLGLSICKRLIEILGGDIQVVSEPGVGSTFSFILPIQRNDYDEENSHH